MFCFKSGFSARITPKMLTRMALLAAISIVIGKLPSFSMMAFTGDSIRISLENLPLIMCGFLYGPLAGGLCAVCADLVGCMLVGYAVNPVITLGACTVGLCAGLFGKRGVIPSPHLWLSVTAAHLLGSVIIKSLGLYLYYSTALPILLWRFPIYVVTGAVEFLIIKLIMKNKALKTLLETV